MGDHDYKILVENKGKQYYARENEVEIENEKKDLKIAASAEILLDEKTPSKNKDLLLELGTYRQKENVSDIKLGIELNDSQSQQLFCKITMLIVLRMHQERHRRSNTRSIWWMRSLSA